MFFRTTVTVKRDLYQFIDDMYSTQNVSAVNTDIYPIHVVDTKTFLTQAAHQIEDFIDRLVLRKLIVFK